MNCVYGRVSSPSQTSPTPLSQPPQAWVEAIRNGVRAAELDFKKSLQLSRAKRFRANTRIFYRSSTYYKRICIHYKCI
jgi:hypothetical protein